MMIFQSIPFLKVRETFIQQNQFEIPRDQIEFSLPEINIAPETLGLVPMSFLLHPGARCELLVSGRVFVTSSSSRRFNSCPFHPLVGGHDSPLERVT